LPGKGDKNFWIFVTSPRRFRYRRNEEMKTGARSAPKWSVLPGTTNPAAIWRLQARL
jgi:hypothetical protein